MSEGYWAAVVMKLAAPDDGKRDTVADCLQAVIKQAIDEYVEGKGTMSGVLTDFMNAAENRNDDFYAGMDATTKIAVWTQLNNFRKQREKLWAPGDR